jgi:hypothetical protein
MNSTREDHSRALRVEKQRPEPKRRFPFQA